MIIMSRTILAEAIIDCYLTLLWRVNLIVSCSIWDDLLNAFIWYFLTLKTVWICLFFEVFCPTREFFTHLETSPLPVKGWKFWPILGTYCHWAVRGLWRATPTVTWDICLECSTPRTRDTGTCCRALGQWSCHYMYLFIRYRSVATGGWTPISSMRGKRSTTEPLYA